VACCKEEFIHSYHEASGHLAHCRRRRRIVVAITKALMAGLNPLLRIRVLHHDQDVLLVCNTQHNTTHRSVSIAVLASTIAKCVAFDTTMAPACDTPAPSPQHHSTTRCPPSVLLLRLPAVATAAAANTAATAVATAAAAAAARSADADSTASGDTHARPRSASSRSAPECPTVPPHLPRCSLAQAPRKDPRESRHPSPRPVRPPQLQHARWEPSTHSHATQDHGSGSTVRDAPGATMISCFFDRNRRKVRSLVGSRSRMTLRALAAMAVMCDAYEVVCRAQRAGNQMAARGTARRAQAACALALRLPPRRVAPARAAAARQG
jgi:hypothetical protein